MADTRLYENVYYSKSQTKENNQNELLQKTQEKVDDLVVILHDNVEKVLERDQKLSDLNEISENLEKRASDFKKQSVEVKRRQWRARMKTRLVFAGICLVLLIIIILIIVQYSI